MKESGGRRFLRIPLPARQQAAADLRAEFALHLELRAAELEAEGLTPEEARAEALRLFGDPEDVGREMLRAATRDVREQRGREAIWNMLRDLRYAGRSLLRTPAFTVVAVATLAVGIGANAAIFSVVDAVLLESLPVPEPGRVMMVYEASEGAGDRNVGNPANFVAWRERSRSFQGMAAFFTVPVTVLGEAEAVEVRVQLAHPDLFPVLGLRPVLGRTFAPEEGAGPPGTAPVVVLSHAFWRDRFGRDPSQLQEVRAVREQVLQITHQVYGQRALAQTTFGMYNQWRCSFQQPGVELLQVGGIRNVGATATCRECSV